MAKQQTFSLADVPFTAVWATDNTGGIPLLDPNMQALTVEHPLTVWGATARNKVYGGTILFYVDDYRFEKCWRDPSGVPNCQPINVVELNFTTVANMPGAVAAYKVYQKRWLARWWQSLGIRVFVDMNVHPSFAKLNLMGVPKGWKAYCTRGSADHLDLLDAEYNLAVERAGTTSILFVVYGGGRACRDHCLKNAYIWLAEESDRKRGVLDGSVQELPQPK
ncbi:MAG: DUF4417 domain-containing protein [Anaerolineae bacterium]|nr:DUF4417 domain-containing protein [Anaerolineae bacterium]